MTSWISSSFSPSRAAPAWTSTSPGNWSNPLDWLYGAIAAGSGVHANFATLTLTTSNSVTLDGSRTIGSMTFGDAGALYNWTLAGSTGSVLTLDAGASTPVISVATNTTTYATSCPAALHLV